MGKIKIFIAQKESNRFNKNQTVWVIGEYANHLLISYNYRGRGRYVTGRISKWDNRGFGYNPQIGPNGLKEIEVSDEFIKRLSHGS